MKALVSIGLALFLMAPTIRDSSVSFHAVGDPGFLSIDGEGGKVTGNPIVQSRYLSGTYKVKLDEIKTGIDLRDNHMQDKYLLTKKFPYAELVLNPVYMEGKQKFTGKMTIKGVTKPVAGVMVFNGTKVSATMSLKMSDFNIETPSYKLVTVGEDVDVKVSFNL